MADDDDLARLMKEIEDFDRATASPAPGPAGAGQGAQDVARRSSEVAETQSGGRGRWALIAAIVAGILGFLVGSVLWFLPYVNGVSLGLGAALGGAAVAAVSRPPRWLS